MAPTNYCATFSSSETSGAEGYFAVSLDDGIANYWYDLNVVYMLVNKATQCDFANGMQYYLSSSVWIDKPQSSRSNRCPTTRYDPNFACGPSTNPSWQCTALKRPLVNVNNSRCTPSTFSAGIYDVCEVGDLSSKFGAAKSAIFPGPKRMKTYSFTSPPGAMVDYQLYGAPSIAYRGDVTAWTSIVFTCDNQPLTCAQFRYVPDGGTSACGFPAAPKALPPTDFSDTAIAIVVVSSVFVAYIVVTVVLYTYGYFNQRRPGGEKIDDE